MKHPLPHLSEALGGAESVQEIEPGIWQQRDISEAPGAQYDFIGSAYNLVAGLDIYHRIFWGVSTRQYRGFCHAALMACGSGMLLDAGCGSLLFTNEACKPDERGTVIGLDASIEMLGLARARTGLLAPRAALVKANVLRTPFRDGAFDAVICLHVAHVLSDLKGLVRETRWILKPGGKLFLTCVVVADPLALRVS